MTNAHGIARDQLRAFVERIERLEEEKKTIADDIKDVYGEAKGMGFDTKVLKKVIALRKKDEQERTEEELILDTYMAALGMIPQLDMFDKETGEVFDREANRRRIMSEDMADHKSLVDEMADAGLISEEAREENKRLADAVATKFGNGPASALQSPRKAAEAVSERTAGEADCVTTSLPINSELLGGFPVAAAETNAEETGGVDADNIEYPKPRQEKETIAESIPPETATECAAPEKDAAADERNVEATVEQRSSATEFNPMEIARPPKTARDYRPHCLKPDACGASGLDHCYSCRRAMKAQEEFA